MLRKQAQLPPPSGLAGGRGWGDGFDDGSGGSGGSGGSSGSGGSDSLGGARDRRWPSGKSRTRVTTTLRRRLLNRALFVGLVVGALLVLWHVHKLFTAHDDHGADHLAGGPLPREPLGQPFSDDSSSLRASLRLAEEAGRKDEEIASLGLPTDEVLESSVAAKASLLEEEAEREAEDANDDHGLPGNSLDHASEDDADGERGADADAEAKTDAELAEMLLADASAHAQGDGDGDGDDAPIIVDHDANADLGDANDEHSDGDPDAGDDATTFSGRKRLEHAWDAGFEAEVQAAAESRYDGVKMLLKKQITLPKKPVIKSINVGQNFWPWYKILRKRGWAHPTDGSVPDQRAHMLLSKGRVPYLRPGRQMLNSIGFSGCIGGSKTVQLDCRLQLARHHGCDYHDLHIQPAQYSMEAAGTCEAMLKVAFLPENEQRMWMYKPSNTFHGKGLKLFRGPIELATKVAHCKAPQKAVVMEYVEKPATMRQGFKFDLRTYLLVASLDPQLVFYADAFARKSDKVYDADDKRTTVHVTNSIMQKKQDHFFSFEEVDAEMQKEMGFPADYLEKAREYMKKVSLYVFKTTDAQAKPLSKAPGRFHLFAIDWIIDAAGNVHLLEGNGYPLVTDYPIQGLTPQVWEDLLDLVLKVHVEPHRLGPHVTVKDGFTHGKWSLIYNKLEEQYLGDSYNPCYSFPEEPLIV